MADGKAGEKKSDRNAEISLLELLGENVTK